MSTGKVLFSSVSGTNFTKRRKVMKGVNPDRKPEIKQWNPVAGSDESDERRSGYTSLLIKPVVSYVAATNFYMTDWKLKYLTMPTYGNSNWDREGNCIFLKAFRFKGYITVKNKLPCGFRWRLKLFRFNGIAPVADSVTAQDHVNNYLKLYRSTQSYVALQDAATTVGFCRHNFYKAFKDLPKKFDYSSKVIASGFIPATTGELQSGAGFVYGTNDAHTTNKFISMSDQVICTLPIDIKVKVNDRIHWTTLANAQTSLDVFYAIALEDDLGVGVKVTQPSYIADVGLTEPSWQFNQTRDDCPVEFNFFIRGYFTDY